MTVVQALPRDRDWTVDDLDALPDDGLQYELIDGVLIVTPAPSVDHQRGARGLFRLLDATCPADCEVFFSPIGYRPSRRSSVEPDVLVVRRADTGPDFLERPLVLVVEVLSPSTRKKDLWLKRAFYEESGCASYWAFDPLEPSLVAWDLVEGRYVEVARVAGSDEVSVARPYPLTLCPSRLAPG